MGDYYRRNNNPTGRAAACKDCEDRKNNLRLANLSHEQYEAMAQRDLIAARKRRQAKQKRMQDGAAYILAELKRYGVTQKEIMARTGFMSRTLKRIESREAKYIYTSTYERLRGLLDEIIAEYA